MTPDVLLAAAEGPVMSETGIPYMLVGGWNSPSIRVIDDVGGLVTRLDPRTGPDDFADSSRASVSVCPGGQRVVQRSGQGLVVWDLPTMEPATQVELPNYANMAVPSMSCRDQDGGSIWYAMDLGPDGGSVVDVLTDEEILRVPEALVYIGGEHVVSQDLDLTRVTRYDIASGAEVVLHEKAADQNWGVYPVPHPSDGRTVIVETRYPDEGGVAESTLRVHDTSGAVVSSVEIPMEASAPMWLDDNTIAVTASDFTGVGEQALYVIDATNGEFSTIPRWPAYETTGDASEVFGSSSGVIWKGEVAGGEITEVANIADESAVTLLVLEDAAPVEVDDQSGQPAGGTAVPPLSVDDGIEVLEGGSTPETQAQSSNLARIAFIVIGVGVVVLGVVAYIRRDRQVKPPSAF
jgi:hypothetical protein